MEVKKRIKVYGIVQGVGFRPTVARHAVSCGVKGTVANCGPYVEIYAGGTPEQVKDFLGLLREEPPRRAVILKMDVKDCRDFPAVEDFQIVSSEKKRGEIFVSPDIAICEDCKRELMDPKNRRYHHPFINCTCCGPRLTILDALPYDRERTSMKEFPMCEECGREYHDPASRRYDAQPVCCNDCGPKYYILQERSKISEGRDAITYARRIISGGGIVAIKGIGGFHLCCSALSDEAVSLLRSRKKRPMKPLAVMLRDEQVAERECVFTEEQGQILTGHQKPILLLPKKNGGRISSLVAPDQPSVGVMLPYAPIHLLLFSYDDGISMPDALVMTSANSSGAPIVKDDEAAERELSHLCDAILSHNRRIRLRADDSVMDFYKNSPYMIRRSRGYAPLPYMMSEEYKGQVLAIGGELKNTFCLGVKGLLYPSAYVGDLADLRTIRALEESIEKMEKLLETRPQLIACDLHPRYNATLVAQKLAEQNGVELLPIQHHYAHIASCMAENDWRDPVIGVSFDGTGYGEDATIWGGEILSCDLKGYKRETSIAPFLQLGGDASSKEGWRIAVSMIYGLLQRGLLPMEEGADRRRAAEEIVALLNLTDDKTVKAQFMMYDRRINAITSTSAGRLFDGVSAILGIRRSSTYEGEASTALMNRALAGLKDPSEAAGMELLQQRYETFCSGREEEEKDGCPPLATDVLVAFLLKERLRFVRGHRVEEGLYGADDENARELALFFHQVLADMITEACEKISRKRRIRTVALSGGCFQNRLLLMFVQKKLEDRNYHVLTHHLIPPNDGGIALGQALIALERLKEKE